MVSLSLVIIVVICLSSLILMMAVTAVIWLQNRREEIYENSQPVIRPAKDDAARWLEALAEGQPITPDNTQELEKYIRSLMKKGRKIEAIKAYRQFSGVGLKEAKEAVEQLDAYPEISLAGEEPADNPAPKQTLDGDT